MKRMSLGLRLAFVLVFLVSMPALPGFAQEGDADPQVHITQVDASAFPRVTVYVSVTDAAGEPLAIDPARIELSENGIPIETTQIQGLGQVEAFTTLLVMDVSGSMNKVGKLETAKSAARQFVRQMRLGDEVGLVTFNTEIAYLQPLTSNQETLIAAITGLTAESDTAMYDGLHEAQRILAPVGGRKAIILLTDGMDNRSQVGLNEIIGGVGPSGLSISAVGLGDPNQQTASTSGIDVGALRSLAAEAGGEYAFANDRQQLTDLYARFARTLQSEYVMSYISPAELHDGFTRDITVSLLDRTGSHELAKYNPGGLIPEVGGPESWTAFFAALAGLVVLLFLPLILGWGRNVFSATTARPKKNTRIRLLD
jgi:VWFA-related protein